MNKRSQKKFTRCKADLVEINKRLELTLETTKPNEQDFEDRPKTVGEALEPEFVKLAEVALSESNRWLLKAIKALGEIV